MAKRKQPKPSKKARSRSSRASKKGLKDNTQTHGASPPAPPNTQAKPDRKPLRQWKPAFLEHFKITGNVRESCKVAGIDRGTAYAAWHKDEAFRKAWKDAEEDAADILEAEAHRRAVEGVERPVFYMGDECGAVREYSDQLLIVLLKARRPGKFRENVKIQHAGHSGGPVEVEAKFENKQSKPIDYDQLASALEKHAASAAARRVRPDGNPE